LSRNRAYSSKSSEKDWLIIIDPGGAGYGKVEKKE